MNYQKEEIMADIDLKYEKLKNILQGYKNVLVAFSGGVDSSLLLYVAQQQLGDAAEAITLKTPYMPSQEVDDVLHLVREQNVKHSMVNIESFSDIAFNPENRCYICKKNLFESLKKIALEKNISTVVEGSNVDDLSDYRPGMQALKELDIKSPLLEAGFTKHDIRMLSKQLGIPVWDKPAYACLMTRVPFDTQITQEMLTSIEMAEKYLHDEGFDDVRVRMHNDLARIELSHDLWNRFLKPSVMQKIAHQIKKFGFNHVAFDLEGYTMGSFNKKNGHEQK